MRRWVPPSHCHGTLHDHSHTRRFRICRIHPSRKQQCCSLRKRSSSDNDVFPLKMSFLLYNYSNCLLYPFSKKRRISNPNTTNTHPYQWEGRERGVSFYQRVLTGNRAGHTLRKSSPTPRRPIHRSLPKAESRTERFRES